MSKEEIIKEFEDKWLGLHDEFPETFMAIKDFILKALQSQNQELLKKMTELRDLKKEEKGKSLDYWEGYTKARNEDIKKLIT